MSQVSESGLNADKGAQRAAPSRRGFFFGAAAVGAAAAATHLRGVTPEPEVLAQAAIAPEGGGGYHESAHVKRYYQTTRI